jgi:hypothetical protein
VDPATPALSHATIEARLREHRAEIPVIVLEDVVSLGDQVKNALAARRS